MQTSEDNSTEAELQKAPSLHPLTTGDNRKKKKATQNKVPNKQRELQTTFKRIKLSWGPSAAYFAARIPRPVRKQERINKELEPTGLLKSLKRKPPVMGGGAVERKQ